MQQQLDEFEEDYARLQEECDKQLEEMQIENDMLSQEVSFSLF